MVRHSSQAFQSCKSTGAWNGVYGDIIVRGCVGLKISHSVGFKVLHDKGLKVFHGVGGNKGSTDGAGQGTL